MERRVRGPQKRRISRSPRSSVIFGLTVTAFVLQLKAPKNFGGIYESLESTTLRRRASHLLYYTGLRSVAGHVISLRHAGICRCSRDAHSGVTANRSEERRVGKE